MKLPPRVVVGADGISRKIAYDGDGERVTCIVLDVPLKPGSAPPYVKSRKRLCQTPPSTRSSPTSDTASRTPPTYTPMKSKKSCPPSWSGQIPAK